MKKPVLLAGVLASGVALGAVLDHSWNAATIARGEECAFVPQQQVAATCQGGALAGAGATTAMIGATAAGAAAHGASGSAGTPGGVGSSGVGGQNAGGQNAGTPLAFTPGCPTVATPVPTYTPAPVVTAPVARVAPTVAPAPALNIARETERGQSPLTALLAIAGVGGLIGLGAWLRRTPRPGDKRRKAAGLAPLVAPAWAEEANLHESRAKWPAEPPPVAFGEPAFAPEIAPAPLPPVDRFEVLPVSQPGASRRKPASKGRRQLTYMLLGAGTIAAIAASTMRGPLTLVAGTAGNVVTKQVESVLPAPKPLPAPKFAENARRRAMAGIGKSGRTGEQAGLVPGAKAPYGGIGRNLGANGAIVSDQGGRAPGGVDPQTLGGEGAEGIRLTDRSGGGNGGGLDPSGKGGSGGGGGSGLTDGNPTGTGITPGGGGNGGGNGGSGNGGGGNGGGGNGGSNGPGNNPDDHLPETDPGTGDHFGTDDHGGGAIEVPEPDTISLLALGIAGLVASRSRRLRQRLRKLRGGTGETPTEL